MKRRNVLRAGAGLVGTAGLAGCGLLETEQRSVRSPPLVEDRPDAVYYPTHVEGMEMVGSASAGEYEVAAMYSYPHRFWTVTGSEANITEIQSGDAMHLMATVWDPETGLVLPETGLDVVLRKDGELVSEEVIYPMLSQPMGFHYGANFEGDGDGSYAVEINVGAVPGDGVRTTGDFDGRFAEPGSATIEFDYSEATKNEISYEELDNAGETGALEPMDMEMLPNSTAPAQTDLPGEVRGTATTGDANLVVSVLESPPAGIEASGQYLAVSARTPHNRMIVPAMSLAGTLTRGDSEVFADTLTRTLDPDLNYHYGAVVDSVESGDTLSLQVETPPQVARHEGYETAFLDMPDAEVTL
ncbi:DUF7350 domain-containing protein [Halorientalis salina]|uniref:DUF7350 domain-containing protein n=1 Tax=Halorientalis salina TaxID=2932266 RepID=UPI0010AC397C|nr:hypothetical protein [Halorientalis salina]